MPDSFLINVLFDSVHVTRKMCAMPHCFVMPGLRLRWPTLTCCSSFTCGMQAAVFNSVGVPAQFSCIEAVLLIQGPGALGLFLLCSQPDYIKLDL